jgi:tetratricopeptide (TPR) repeat protein
MKALAHALEMDEETALNLLEEASTSEDHLKSLEADLYFQAGKVLLADGERAHIGLHYLKKAVSLSPEKGPESIHLMKSAAKSLVSQKPWLSHRMLESVAELDPASGQEETFYYHLHIKTLNDPTEKIEFSDKFTHLFPESPLIPDVLFEKAESYYSLGKFSEAKIIFQEIEKNFKDSPSGIGAKKRLDDWREFRRIPVKVLPDLHAIPTGVFVETGQKLTIGAAGISLEGSYSQWPDGRRGSQSSEQNFPLPTAPPMALIGKVGENGPWFLIGRGFVGSADRKGEVFLMMNLPKSANKNSDTVKRRGFYSAMIQIEDIKINGEEASPSP